ncbi:hypothetical protein [Hyalangium versicolor]|uniref:hypothetical protein n=1 Tax=Hyalangium versicolor TaxID=2861190 RepID=UPI001CCA0EA4|nr:hypothetical protein [Hyalangium versicolor]
MRGDDEAFALLAEALTTRSGGKRERMLLVDALRWLRGAAGANLLLGRHHLSPGLDIRSAEDVIDYL